MKNFSHPLRCPVSVRDGIINSTCLIEVCFALSGEGQWKLLLSASAVAFLQLTLPGRRAITAALSVRRYLC